MSTREAPAAAEVDRPAAGWRIGDVAAQAGVSTRTLRYYEEIGLLSPSGRTAGGERRYQDGDVAQLRRILELRDLLGMNLDAISRFTASQRRLDELRAEYLAHEDAQSRAAHARRRAILAEAIDLRSELVGEVEARLRKLAEFRSRVQADADRCRALLAEMG